eukprot:g59839.t1
MLQEKRNSLVLDEVGEVFPHLSTDESPDEPGAPSPILPASINCTSNGPPDKAESPGPMPSAPVEEVKACPAESLMVPRPATINSPVEEEACPTRESQDFHQDRAFVSPEGRSTSAPANLLNVGDFRRGMVVAAFAIVLFVCIATIAREIAVMKERIAYLEGGLGAWSLNGSIASDVHQEVAGMSHRLAAVERQLFERSLGVNNTPELNQEVEVMKQRLNSLHGLLSGYVSDTADSIEEVMQEVTSVQGLIKAVAINTSSLGQELAGMKQENVGEQDLINSLARNASYLSQQFASVKQEVASLRSIEEKVEEQFTLVAILNRTLMARRPKVTNFTAGNGTFYPEEGTRFIRVRMIGGGRAGGPDVCGGERGGDSVFGPFSAGGGGLYHQDIYGPDSYSSGSYGDGGLPNISDDGITSAVFSTYTGSGHKNGDSSYDINCWNCDFRSLLVTRFMDGVRNGGSRGHITTYARGASPNQYYHMYGGPGASGAYLDVFIVHPAVVYKYVVGRGGTVGAAMRYVTPSGSTYECTNGTPYHYSAYGNSIDYKTIAPKPGRSGFVEVTEFF